MNEPLASVEAKASTTDSKTNLTDSLGPNPWPLTTVELPGGPAEGDSEIDAARVPAAPPPDRGPASAVRVVRASAVIQRRWRAPLPFMRPEPLTRRSANMA